MRQLQSDLAELIMAKEYVVRISSRDTDKPLSDEVLLELGVSQSPETVCNVFTALAGLIKVCGNFKKVAEEIGRVQNQSVKNLLSGF